MPRPRKTYPPEYRRQVVELVRAGRSPESRLFTVAIGDASLRPAAAVDAHDRTLNPEDTEYDELLVYRDKVIVLGVSYLRTTAELVVFQISPQGRLRYLTTYQFKAHR